MVSARRPSRRRDAGYNLVILAVLLTIMNVVVAAALPLWSTAIRREKEEELIFRGFQYVEAIRVFQRRFGRQPVRLEELIEVQPRSIRRLWKDPMTADGRWGILYAEGQPPAPGQAPPTGEDPEGRPAPDAEGEEGAEGEPGEGAPPRVAPIVGVFSKSDEESIKVLFGQQRYRDWKFSVQVFGMAGIGPEGVAPGVRSIKGLGRPFRHETQQPSTTLDPLGRDDG